MKRVNISSTDFTKANLKSIDWEYMETKEVQIYKGHTYDIFSVAISPSCKILSSSNVMIDI